MRLNWTGTSSTVRAYVIAFATVVVVLSIGTLIFAKGSTLAVFLLDYSAKSFFAPVYPLTIQNFMYLMMAIGLADLWVRHAATAREARYRDKHLLPEDDSTILQVDDLGAIRKKVSDLKAGEDAFLPQLIDLSVLQLLTS